MRRFFYFGPEWSELDFEADFAARINALADRDLFADGMQGLQRSLPFYPGGRLLQFRHTRWVEQQQRLCFLEVGDKLVWLNGTSPPIHEVNATGALLLDEANVLDYLCFFCFFVRGEEGPFLILDSIDTPFLPKGITDYRMPAGKGPAASFAELFRPPMLHGRDAAGKFRVDAMMYYSNAVFTADMLVQPGGMVEMQDDEPMLADLPSKIDAPLIVRNEDVQTTH